MKRIMFTIISVTFSSILFAGVNDFVYFNDGGTSVIDYYVHYSPEIPDCSVSVGSDTSMTITKGARIDYKLYAHDDSSITMNGGDIWDSIHTDGNSVLFFTGGYVTNAINVGGHSNGVIDGGYAGGINAGGNSTLSVKNGNIAGDMGSAGNATVTIEKLMAYSISAGEYSRMTIINATSGHHLLSAGYSNILIEGGTFSGGLFSIHSSQITMAGGITDQIQSQMYSNIVLVGNFKYQIPNTNEFSDKFYYGSLANQDVSTHGGSPSDWYGRLKGTFKNGTEVEFPYGVYRTNPDWTCDITIVPAENTVTVLSPNGSEYINVGSVHPITWQSYGNIEQVFLEYSLDNGQVWNSIDTVPNTGSYEWTVPTTVSNQCLIRISDAVNVETFDVSDAVFSIGNPQVYFADANLKLAVEQALSVTHPTYEDMLKLTYLNAKSKGITSLIGLETALNLTTLYLHQNSISDLSPLAGLNKLTVLNLYLNNITDISPLSGLTKLYSLAISSNKISDIHPLSGMVNLIYLYINNNQISDFSPITTQTKFKEIYATRNAVLTKETYLTHIPTIRTNNPNLKVFQYDPGCQTLKSTDVNQDCRVNLLDLAIIASDWLTCNHIYEEMCP